MSETTSTVCPRCGGRVFVPKKVRYVKFSKRYAPGASCIGCGVQFHWQTKPVDGSVYSQENGRRNVWFCDRILNAPEPEVENV